MTNPPDPEDGQTRLIGCDDPLILATGGPGSGKTQAALLLAVRLLESEPAGSTRSVLFLTFSRAATRELLERSPRLVPKALRHRLEITTFHGYSRTILESFGRFNGRGTDPLTIASRTEVKLKLSPPGSLALDDLIPEAVKLLKASPLLCDRLSRRLVAVISDEYQDTGDAQDQMLELLSSQSRLLCLADPDQMIYDFIADVSPRRLTLLRAKNPTEIPLEQRSHRDPSGLIPRVARAIHDRQFADPALAEALRCGRLRVRTDTNPLFAGVVEEVRALRIAGHRSVGVFVSQRFMVEELGRELGAAKIEHEIAGLDDAAGEAETVISSLAMYATGQATWDDVCQRMAVFLTSSQPKHGVPDVAWMLMGSRQYLPGGLPTRLLALQDALDNLAGRPINDLFPLAYDFMRLFGWGQRLWRIGSRDLAGQIAAFVREPLSAQTALAIDAVAHRRQGDSNVDEIVGGRLPVRLMTTFQAKGREMDAIILVHHSDDIIKDNEHSKIQRVHFVAVSRARQTVSIVLPPNPHWFMGAYRSLGH